jgi:16S rRNA (cytidine1402-2'-O)-methyltransferase
MLPIPIFEGNIDSIPLDTLNSTTSLNHFIVERAKTARAYLKQINHPTPIQEIDILEIPQKDFNLIIEPYLRETIFKGIDVGIMSEAGCPGIADPGAKVIEMAHRKGITVKSKVGPSSILLALMASGFNGQEFHFYGYLSNKKPQLVQELKRIEKEIFRNGSSHIFIETPYRNGFLIETIIDTLNDNSHLSMSIDINASTEQNIRKSIKEWKKEDLDNFHKRPAVFILGKPQN